MNFGCPAQIVNRHGGGAALLDHPETLHAIVAAVRRAVPARMPVSAKMRLGTRDDALAIDCALALEAGGADEIAVHARTKAQAYRPPAFWGRIADIRAVVKIPVIGNGEIWTVNDALACLEQSGCQALMLGRGMVADPGLGLAVKAHLEVSTGLSEDGDPTPVEWDALLPALRYFWGVVCSRLDARSRAGRLKQWLNFLRRRFPQAQVAYDALKRVDDPALISAWMSGLDGGKRWHHSEEEARCVRYLHGNSLAPAVSIRQM